MKHNSKYLLEALLLIKPNLELTINFFNQILSFFNCKLNELLKAKGSKLSVLYKYTNYKFHILIARLKNLSLQLLWL